MSEPRLYLAAPLASGARLALEPAANQHLVRVLRLQRGATVTVFNGEGGEYRARIVSLERGQATLEIGDWVEQERESALPITLIQGVSRGERMDYTIQKAVELGVHAIVPVLTERSVVRLDGTRAAKRRAHWQGVCVHACQQCGRNRLPPIEAPEPLRDWLARGPHTGWVLDPQADIGLAAGPPDKLGPNFLLVGPEGGLSPAELQQATAAGLRAVRLGPRILRTETAAVAALAALQTLWGDYV